MKNLETTQQWWDRVSSSETEMINWLKAQYHGEVTAGKRIMDSKVDYHISPLEEKIISSIASDEYKHAAWVKQLLIDRDITPEILKKEERYWNEVLPKVLEENTFTYICAVGHLAETMRLDRISLLASDSRFSDIAKVMSNIYPDEIFHARAFKLMSTEADITKASEFHNIGMNAIGLVA